MHGTFRFSTPCGRLALLPKVFTQLFFSALCCDHLTVLVAYSIESAYADSQPRAGHGATNQTESRWGVMEEMKTEEEDSARVSSCLVRMRRTNTSGIGGIQPPGGGENPTGLRILKT